MGLTVITDNKNINVKTSQKVIRYLPVGWDEEVAAFGRGYNYPNPTGQETIYRIGDDAWVEDNFFAPVRDANSLKIQNSLVDFFTLKNDNIFGNRNRFTDLNGLQLYPSRYKIDNYTGIGWIIDQQSPQLNWEDVITSSLSLSLAGFDDYFVPNFNQWSSILDFEGLYVYNSALDGIGSSNRKALSTTRTSSTTRSYYWNYWGRSIGTITKGSQSSMVYYPCRKHF